MNPRQEKFAQLVAGGMAASRAYEKAGYKTKGHASEASAGKLLRNAEVAAYVAKLRAAAKSKGEEAAFLTINEKREFLRRVVLTPIYSVDEESELCQAAEYRVEGGLRGRLRRGHHDRGNEEGALETTVKIKLPCKLRAIELDAKLAGEFESDRNAGKAADALASLMQSIAARSHA